MKKIALIFPGQGSQYIGMGKKLYKNYRIVRDTYEEASSILGFDLTRLCFEGEIEELTRTENAQPAILVTSVAAFRVYNSEIGLKPCIAAGHSLGEFSALTCAGAIRFCDAVQIVRKRGILMKNISAEVSGSMVAVSGLDSQLVEGLCRRASDVNELAVISNYNSPTQTVISGHSGKIAGLARELEKQGAKLTYLNVSAPFHSPIVEPMAKKLGEEMKIYQYLSFKWPVISNVDALPYSDPGELISKMVKQVAVPVKWEATMKYLEKLGVNLIVELGPKTVLKKLARENTPSIEAFSFDLEKDMQELVSITGNKKMDNTKRTILNLLNECIASSICTKNSNFDNNEYISGVIKPYLRLHEMRNMIEAETGFSGSPELIREAIEMLKLILNAKLVPNELQHEILSRIVRYTENLEIKKQLLLELLV